MSRAIAGSAASAARRARTPLRTVSNPDGGDWSLVEPLGNTGNSAAEIARALTDAGYVVDLVPSTEVDAGRVSTDRAGRTTYAGRSYPAAVLAYPERSRASTLDWAGRVGNLGVVGDATTDSEGRPVGPAWAAIRSRARVVLAGVPISPAPVIFQAAAYTPTTNPVARSYASQLASGLGLTASSHPDGHELEDGTMLITDGSRYEGSTPELDFRLDGHRVQAEGGEFFAIRLGRDGEVDRLAGDRLRSVRIDGRLAFRFDRAYDLALYRERGHWELAYRGPPPTDPFLRRIPVGTPVKQLRCSPARGTSRSCAFACDRAGYGPDTGARSAFLSARPTVAASAAPSCASEDARCERTREAEPACG